MKPRRSRQLSAEERRLWAHVARAVKPLPGHSFPDLPPEPPAGPAAEPAPAMSAAPAPHRAARAPALPPLAPIERKTLVALRRGARRADGAIDLHGMRQSEAHRALIGFLHRSRERGHEVVLVITGKGGRRRGRQPLRGARRPAPRRAALAAAAGAAHGGARLRGGRAPPWRLGRALCPAASAPRAGRAVTPFGRRVRELRRERGLLLKDMAAHLGVSVAYLSALERGERAKPTWTLLQGVLQYFRIIWDEADELLRLADLSEPKVKIDASGRDPDTVLFLNRLARELPALTDEEVAAMAAVLDKAAARAKS